RAAPGRERQKKPSLQPVPPKEFLPPAQSLFAQPRPGKNPRVRRRSDAAQIVTDLMNDLAQRGPRRKDSSTPARRPRQPLLEQRGVVAEPGVDTRVAAEITADRVFAAAALDEQAADFSAFDRADGDIRSDQPRHVAPRREEVERVPIREVFERRQKTDEVAEGAGKDYQRAPGGALPGLVGRCFR